MNPDLIELAKALQGLSAPQLAGVVLLLIAYIETRWRKPWVAHLERGKVSAVRLELLAEKNGVTDEHVAARIARSQVSVSIEPPSVAA